MSRKRAGRRVSGLAPFVAELDRLTAADLDAGTVLLAGPVRAAFDVVSPIARASHGVAADRAEREAFTRHAGWTAQRLAAAAGSWS